MNPAHTSIGNPSLGDYIISLEEARDWAGFFQDSSNDAEIELLIKAAEEKIIELSGKIVSLTPVVDYYYYYSPYLCLSHDCNDKARITSVQYINKDSQAVVIDPTKYDLDVSSKRIGLYFVEGFRVDNSTLSVNIANPFSVAYNAGISIREEGLNTLKMCMQMLIECYSKAKGEDLMNVARTEKAIANLLRNYRLGIG